MTHPKQIARPKLKDARNLSPMELNSLKFCDRRTVLTPKLLETPDETCPDSRQA